MLDEMMSDPRVNAFLAAREVGVLATINRDGSPLATPMWFALRDNRVLMVSVDDQKVKNLRRDPRASLAVEAGSGGDIKCVILRGAVTFVTDARALKSGVTQLLRKYDPHLERRWGTRDMPPDRVLFELRPAHVKLWNFER